MLSNPDIICGVTSNFSQNCNDIWFHSISLQSFASNGPYLPNMYCKLLQAVHIQVVETHLSF